MACSGCSDGNRAKTTRDLMLSDHEAFQLLREIAGGSWTVTDNSLVFVPDLPGELRQERYVDPADAVLLLMKSG